MVEIAQVHTYSYKCGGSTCCRCLRKTLHLLVADSLNEVRYNHEEYDEQIVIGHLDVVGVDLEGCEYRCHYEAPQITTFISQNDTGNHRRKIRQSHHLPQVTGSNDDKEIARECPHYSS